MTIRHVDSKEHMLSENDIILVAVHDHPAGAKQIWEKMKKPKGVSPERALYSVWCRAAASPAVLRLREGNTMLAVMGSKDADPSTVEVVMFDADVPARSIGNMATVMNALRKQGIKRVKAHGLNDYAKTAAKLAFRKYRTPGDDIGFVGGSMTLEFA